ncbi:hypothetical protein [Virgibacillus alimentarius]|uniref:hypothetical protein n=1 Tax=Virgibacillus alimentarius TaxID=698769 RepID=UPI0004933DB1|nr:hypothetical protein [Virgibacillus alimentarius]
MRKLIFFIFVTAVLVLTFVLMYKNSSLPTITYFPIDEENTFTNAYSELNFSNKDSKDSYVLQWISGSKSSQPLYLRQDVSLLYENGQLRGVRSKWIEDTDTIKISEKLDRNKESIFDVISFHHGEIHSSEENIKSIQEMTHDELYVFDSISDNEYKSFRSPQNKHEHNKKDALDQAKKSTLLHHWNQLITHFNINKESYTSIPLSRLYLYDDRSLSGMDQEETNKIIGQLWEGLYKNYIIPAANLNSMDKNSNYIPLILISKDRSHLVVLFELNGKKEKLIQRL